jgi:hypothetical protein
LVTALARRGFYVPNALTPLEKRVMECVRDSRLPWECFPKIVEVIACVNHLIDREFIEDCSGIYRLTDLGRAALEMST